MVTKTRRSTFDTVDLNKVAARGGYDYHIVLRIKELMKDIKEEKKRQPRPPAPEGSISQSEASRKYSVPQETISRWTRAGYILRDHDDGWVVYIDEARVAKLAEVFKSSPGRGSWAVKRFIEQEKNSPP